MGKRMRPFENTLAETIENTMKTPGPFVQILRDMAVLISVWGRLDATKFSGDMVGTSARARI